MSLAAHLDGLSPDKRAKVDALLDAIREAHPGLTEHIKWNAPSFVLDGDDRVTLNLKNREGLVKVVLHMGATRPEDKKAPPIMADDTGLLEWHSDSRASMTFHDAAEIAARRSDIMGVVSRWLAIR